MNPKEKKYYFIGIGGIGMSAIAGFYHESGCFVAGYDKTASEVTERLQSAGISICFEEDVTLIPVECLNRTDCTVIYTPAVPIEHLQLKFFFENGFKVIKRSEALADVAYGLKCVAIAGTHGKTSISTLAAWILNQNQSKANAFLGGISSNFNSNLVLHHNSEIVVLEADEYDRSFLKLHPDIALISYVDADHLDIYGNQGNMIKAYNQFINQVKPNGTMILKSDLHSHFLIESDCKLFTYSVDDENADFHPANIVIENGKCSFDIITPFRDIRNVHFSYAGRHQIENAIASVALAICAGANDSDVFAALESFSGVKRRFDFVFRSKKHVYIDDYAHHPREIQATLDAVKLLFPEKRITAIFQPHLYSRTRDFVDEFAKTLSAVDELILLDIYPAREIPIEGVTSAIIFEKLTINDKIICRQEVVPAFMKDKLKNIEVLVTMGAGDIDRLVEPLKRMFLDEEKNS